MDQTAKQIERQIERNRENLSSNLQELEDKMKTIVDWRHHTRQNPAAVLGLAFGGGILLSTLLKGRRKSRHLRADSSGGYARSSMDRSGRSSGHWQAIRDGLLAAAASKVQDTLEGVVPALRDYFSSSTQKHSSEPTSPRTRGRYSVQGEGDYESAKRYRQQVEHYVEHADIDEAAHNAAPADEREAAELEAAERVGRRGAPHSDLRSQSARRD